MCILLKLTPKLDFHFKIEQTNFGVGLNIFKTKFPIHFAIFLVYAYM